MKHGRGAVMTAGFLSAGLALAGCPKGPGETSATPSAPNSGSAPATNYPNLSPSAYPTNDPSLEGEIIYATVAHTQDVNGRPIGVRVYAGPYDIHQTDYYAEGEQLPVVCRALGRTAVDPNVPNKGGFVLVFSEWVKIETPLDQTPQEWIGRPYLDLGGVTLPACTPDQIAPGS